jgi:hypothetical protein
MLALVRPRALALSGDARREAADTSAEADWSSAARRSGSRGMNAETEQKTDQSK